MLHEFVQFDGLTCNGFLCYPVAKKVVPMVSKAQSKASNKYRAKAYDMIQIATPKGTRDRWRALAEMAREVFGRLHRQPGRGGLRPRRTHHRR